MPAAAESPAVSRRNFSCAVLGLTFLASVLLASAATAQGAPAVRVKPELLGDGPRIWWNMKPYVDSLGLAVEQRKAMDELFERHRATRRELARAYGQQNLAFAEALARADFEAAEKANTALATKTAELTRLANDLKTDVIRRLTPAQRAKLEAHPAVLRQPWLAGGPQGAWSQRLRPGG